MSKHSVKKKASRKKKLALQSALQTSDYNAIFFFFLKFLPTNFVGRIIHRWLS